ncbi:hypothetical protein EVAR_73731_1 [Eumeta japonica]|uniref:Uncharacterized protein n=1 Tax=Eumeta variegata TaxID=151549 RepID=A0A4C1TST7_EUMVA|nr:hypothetical protein EVAR_73731_1 [Eumeta japonica]
MDKATSSQPSSSTSLAVQLDSTDAAIDVVFKLNSMSDKHSKNLELNFKNPTVGETSAELGDKSLPFDTELKGINTPITKSNNALTIANDKEIEAYIANKDIDEISLSPSLIVANPEENQNETNKTTLNGTSNDNIESKAAIKQNEANA